MIVALDVDYGPARARAAAVAAPSCAAAPDLERVLELPGPPADYEPGQFWRRELPPLLALLRAHEAALAPLELLLVDGHAWLAPGQPGLGARLHEALGGRVPVIGVAKTAFRGSPDAAHVLRGESQAPLFVTAVGLDQALAAEHVRRLHGPHRLPTLLKRVDALARGRS